MRLKKTGNSNGWKWAFLLLVSALLAFALVLGARILTYREDTSQIAQSTTSSDTKIGTFLTTRDQLNDTISVYLKEYQTEQFIYKVYATNQLILFEASYTVFGVTIPLYIYLQPSKLEDGSVLLTVSELSAGTLSLPKSEILTYIKKNYKLPAFVSIDVEKATITVQLAELENAMNIYFKANTIDLYNDQIIFDIYRKNQ